MHQVLPVDALTPAAMLREVRYNNHTPLKPDMIVSNEPGYYENGSFGIRIENLLKVVEKNTLHNFADER